MIIRVDIDGTICNTGDKYEEAEPIQNNIDKINSLYDEGHHIIYWTARGTTTKIDWTALTVEQLNKWGCKYDSLELGKPFYDMIIDDKAVHAFDMHHIGE